MLMRDPDRLPLFFNYYVSLLSFPSCVVGFPVPRRSARSLSRSFVFLQTERAHVDYSPRISIRFQMYEHGTDKMLERRDLLHPNANGHKSMADMIIIYLAQQVSAYRSVFYTSLLEEIGKRKRRERRRGDETRRLIVLSLSSLSLLRFASWTKEDLSFHHLLSIIFLKTISTWTCCRGYALTPFSLDVLILPHRLLYISVN